MNPTPVLKPLLLCLCLALPGLIRAEETKTADKIIPAIAHYEKAWQEKDAAVRLGLLEQALTAEALYKDPSATVHGPAAVSTIIAKVYKDFPQISIVRSSQINAYGTAFRYAWKMVTPDGTVMLEGFDYGELAPDGRITSIIGFWGLLAPLADVKNEATAAK